MRHLTIALLALPIGCRSPDPSPDPGVDTDPSADPPLQAHCALDATCPEVLVEGDPHAMILGGPAPYRGYGDPSLTRDPDTGTLWMTYSWLQPLIGTDGDVDLGVRTHLARSDDGGASFTFVGQVNENERRSTSVGGEDVELWSIREVSTLARHPDGRWSLLWLYYDEPAGPAERFGFHYERRSADTPAGLLDAASVPWIGTTKAAPDLDIRHRLDVTVPELADCTLFTEPALFAHEGATWLVTQCLTVGAGGARDLARDRLVLLRESDDGYDYVGALTGVDEATVLGADVLTQPELTRGRDGRVHLLVTPKILGADPEHQGCVALEVEDLATATLARDGDGAPRVHARITADGNGLGPGLCSHHPDSETGVLMVITTVDLASNPPDIAFSLRATGVRL